MGQNESIFFKARKYKFRRTKMGCASSRSTQVVSPLSKAAIVPNVAWLTSSTRRSDESSSHRLAELAEKGVQVEFLCELKDRQTQTDAPFLVCDDLQTFLDEELMTRPLIVDVETQTFSKTPSTIDDVKSVLIQTEQHAVLIGRRMHVDMNLKSDKVTIDIGIQVMSWKVDHFTQTERFILGLSPSRKGSMQSNISQYILSDKSSDVVPSSKFSQWRVPAFTPITADFESQTDPVTRALAANAADSDLNILDTVDDISAHVEKNEDRAGIHDSFARLLEDVEQSLRHDRDTLYKRNVQLRSEVSVQTDNDPITDESPEFAARPPPCKKREMIPNMLVFKDIDQHAVDTPEETESSLKTLVEYLISEASNDIQRVRAFFRWIANNITYDWRYMEVKMSAEEVLRRKEGVCKDYCKIFTEMCKLASIRVKKIQGFAKGYDYRPGHCFRPGQDVTHAWNAVFIFGAWRLIDTTWGTGYTDHTGRFQRKLNEHFFFTDPEVMLWTHFPYDEVEHDYSRWQLADTPITLDEFNLLPKVTPFFFEYSLKVRSRPQNSIQFKVQTEIKLHSHEPMRYKFKLYPIDELENSSLNNYVFSQLKEDRLVGSFSVQPPTEGRYYLKIYAKPEREMRNDTSLHNVVIIIVECIRSRKYLQPYPTSEVPWGPTQSFFDYKMKLLNQTGPVVASWGGRRKLIFEQSEAMIISTQLTDSDGMDMDLKAWVLREDQNNRITFTITPIRVGLYKFLIFGMSKPKNKGKWRLPLLATFLIDCKMSKQYDEDYVPSAQNKDDKDDKKDDKKGKKKKRKMVGPHMMR